jgi:hypothetical protein
MIIFFVTVEGISEVILGQLISIVAIFACEIVMRCDVCLYICIYFQITILGSLKECKK